MFCSLVTFEFLCSVYVKMHGLHSPPTTSIKWSGTYGQLNLLLITPNLEAVLSGKHVCHRFFCRSFVVFAHVLRQNIKVSDPGIPNLTPTSFGPRHVWHVGGSPNKLRSDTWEACVRAGAMVLLIAWQVCKHPASFSAPRAPKGQGLGKLDRFSDRCNLLQDW